jgi:hypothetical protein
MNLQENISRIKEMMLEQKSMGFISIFPTVDTLTKKTQLGWNPIGGTNNTNIIYLTRRGKDGKEIPNSKFSYKLSGSKGLFDFNIVLRNVTRNVTTGDLIGEVLPKSSVIASIMKNLVPKDSLTEDGWMYIKVPVDKLNDALTQLYKNRGSKAQIEVEEGITINLVKV